MDKIFRPFRFWSAVMCVTGTLLIPSSELRATTHVILFGGAVGFNYSPNTLTVNVGDTVRWQGDFPIHPLSSTTIPAGAASWSVSSGTVFSYPVAIAGTYDYRCDFHFAFGMVGSFDASTPTGVISNRSELPLDPSLQQSYPNPFNPTTTIQFSIPEATHVTLRVFDVLGQEIVTLVNEKREAGRYDVEYNASGLSSGAYFYRLQAGDFVQTKRLILLK